jgi:pyruvate,water dikinase
MPDHIKTFFELNKSSTHIAGGKGASLGEMTQTGIPVPLGFVILAKAFDCFLEETDLNIEIEAQLKKVNYKDINSVNQVSMIIRDLIHDARMPKDLQEEILKAHESLANSNVTLRFSKGDMGFNAMVRDTSTKLSMTLPHHNIKTRMPFLVAVRSSATAEDSSAASWAGELESYLNTTKDNLLGNVKKCWSSLFTERAIFYRNEQGMRQSKVSVAVVVQKMVQSEISGICFTVHPVTKDKNQMIIEAGWGLGEAIVSGQITPDSYVLSKKDWRMIDINIAKQEKMIVRKIKSKKIAGNQWLGVPKNQQEKQKLTGEEIVRLAKICAQIEKHYKFPCDIEWAYEGKKFYIVQSRPITTL